MQQQTWEMTFDEYRKEHIRLYETLKNNLYVHSDFHRYSSDASFELHQEAIKKIPNKTLNQCHYIAVKRAISEGKSVPIEVLKDYPDIAN